MEGQSNGGWLSLGRRTEKCCHTGAEIAQHHARDWPAIGESDGLIDPACYDLEAYGRLTMAVLALAGRPFNAQPVAAPEFAVSTRTGTVMVCDVSRQRIQEIRDI